MKSQAARVVNILLETDVAGLRFHDFGWLKNMAGFGQPVDVYFNEKLIGTLETDPDGYRIMTLHYPDGKRKVRQEPRNKFKTKNDAGMRMLDAIRHRPGV